MATNNKISSKPGIGRKAVTKAFAKQDSEQNIEDAIRLKAYELYVERGYTDGNHENDWLAAERIVLGSA